MRTHKLTAWILAVIMLVSLLPISAFAAEPGDMNLEVTAGDGCITVTWNEIKEENVTYIVFSSDVDGENYKEYEKKPEYSNGEYTYVIEELENDKTYTVGVEAICESFKYGSMTAMADATPYSADATVPDAPIITKLISDDKTITLSWLAPKNDGGAKIIGYEIECCPEGSTDGNGGMTIGLDADATTYTIDEFMTEGTAYDVKICAINPVGRGKYGIYSGKKEFDDVHKVNHWAKESVDYAYENGLMNGTSETQFSPDKPLTRAMLVTVLWRMENAPQVNYLMNFEDVANETYYTEAVRWAASEKLVNGVGAAKFAPNANITREQIATILYRYAQYKNYHVSDRADIFRFNDGWTISDYALPAMKWAVGAGLMVGSTGKMSAPYINPRDNATRAETAAILERFIKSAHECEEIAILYTNDVHCGIEDNIGYAGLAAYKNDAEEDYEYVALADCGDAIQGDFVGTVSKGEYIVDIMNELEYDFAVLGNHEFDYGMEQLSYLIDKSNAQYLGCNIDYSGKGENLLSAVKPYEIAEYGDTKVAFIGVSTPESHTKSTPTYFMEDGEFVYNFVQGNDGYNLYECVQEYVDECEELGADYVIVLSHLGDAEESSPYTSVELIEATDGIDAVLDGHAHSVIESRVVDNINGEDVLLSSTGTKLENIGKLVICEDGTITTELVSGYAEKDAGCEKFIEGIKAKYAEEMNKVVATSDIALSCKTEDGIRLVRNRETTIGNLCADAYRAIGGADIGVVNGGGIRADLPKGDITYANMLAVHPFGNTLCVVKTTGQEIIDLLETACMYTKSEFAENGNAVGEKGGFMQVSGLRFTIDTSVSSSVELDENENFVSVKGERRVKDIMVLDEKGEYVPIDPEKVYTLASHNYLLKDGGDSYTKFMDNEFIISEGISDYQVLTEYITKILNGNLSEKYAETEGRIVVK